MQPSLEKLRKFFRLEHENGYSNNAIIGGLAKMLNFWEGEARMDGVSEEVIQAVEQRLRSYDGLSPESRADALKGLWKRIGETYPEATQRPARRERRPPRPQPVETTSARPHPSSGRSRPVAPRSEAAPGAKHSQTPAALDAPLTVLQGVGSQHAVTLESLGMRQLGDLLY